MIYSKSSQYAIRAVAYLGQAAFGKLCTLEEIAREEGIPQQFLAKLMQRLTKKRLIRSLKGKHGGFALLQLPEAITLYMIVDAVEDLSYGLNDCILGRGECSKEGTCPLHDAWEPIREQQLHFLQSNTIADMLRTRLAAPEHPVDLYRG